MVKQFQIIPFAITLVICLALSTVAGAEEVRPASSVSESELISVITGDSPAGDKAIACKRLAIYGSSESVAALAKLLSDKQLASWARIALEAIPGPDSSRVLRQASRELEGKLQIGAINSLGVLKDEDATELLVELLNSPDDQVVSAAAVALGHIGGSHAAKGLLSKLNTASNGVCSILAEGCILCAENMVDEGQASEAVKLYNGVRNTELPKQRILEAIRGEILASGKKGIPLLIEQLHDDDRDRFRLALTTAREFPGGEVDKALAKEMAHLEPEKAALVIRVLADRTQTGNLPILLQSAQQGPIQIREVALEALAEVGDESCLSALLEVVETDEERLAKLAMEAIAELSGERVDSRILFLLTEATDDQLVVLFECIGHRRIKSTSNVLKQLNHPNQQVRNASLFALGETLEPSELSVLISRSSDPNHSEDHQVAQKALLAASIRMPDREACATELTAAFEDTKSTETKVALLNILGQVGGKKALETLGRAAASDDLALIDIATQSLGKWMTADAAPTLLDLSLNLPEGKYQVRSLRAYIRIARQLPVPENLRTEMCRKAMEIATRSQEQELVLEVLKRHPSEQNLQLAKKLAKLPNLTEAADKVIESILQSLAKTGKANNKR